MPKSKDRVSNWWVIKDDAADSIEVRAYRTPITRAQLMNELMEPDSPNWDLVVEHELPEDSGVLLTVQGELFIWCIRTKGAFGRR